MANKIKVADVDWGDYRKSVEGAISNERLWATEFSRENIADLEDELEMIDNEAYEDLLAKYDDEVWEHHLK